MRENTTDGTLNNTLLEPNERQHDERFNPNPEENIENLPALSTPITTPALMSKLVGALIVENLSKNLSDIGLYYFVSKLGTEQLAASDLIANYSTFLTVFGYIGFPVITLLGTEIGKMSSVNPLDNNTIIQIQRNQGAIIQNVWVLGGVASIASLSLSLAGTRILSAVGTSKNLLPFIQDTLFPYAFALPAIIQTNLDNAILATFDHKKAIVCFNLLRTGIEIGLGACLIPRLGLMGFGLTKLISGWSMQIVFKSYIKFNSSFKSLSIFSPRLISTLHYMKSLTKLGLPIMIYSLALAGSGLGTVIIMDRFGNDQLSLDQATVQLINWFQVLSVSISRASSMIVAKALGANQLNLLSRYGNFSIVLSSLVFLPAIAIPIFPKALLGIYLSDDVLKRLGLTATVVSSLAVIEYVAGGVKDTSSENLRSLYDTIVPSIITSVGSLSIMPLSYLLGDVAGYKIEGVYSAVVVVFVLMAIILFSRWLLKSTHANDIYFQNFGTQENLAPRRIGPIPTHQANGYQGKFFSAHQHPEIQTDDGNTQEFKYE